jgi:hypothetical protein
LKYRERKKKKDTKRERGEETEMNSHTTVPSVRKARLLSKMISR